MGQSVVDQFARFFVIPQAGHGLNGSNYSIGGDGKTTIPIRSDPEWFQPPQRVLTDWVEKKIVPAKSYNGYTRAKRAFRCARTQHIRKYVGGPSAVREFVRLRFELSDARTRANPCDYDRNEFLVL